MKDHKEKIKECIDYLNSVRFPCEDWQEDKKYFDSIETELLSPTDDSGITELQIQLKKLIDDKRVQSLNMNKTAEELYAGWNDE